MIHLAPIGKSSADPLTCVLILIDLTSTLVRVLPRYLSGAFATELGVDRLPFSTAETVCHELELISHSESHEYAAFKRSNI
jgi:hypothetical protein